MSLKTTVKRILTPEQIALSEQRKRKKADAAANAAAAAAGSSKPEQLSGSKILCRSWLTADNTVVSKYRPHQNTTLMSWNMLAQCLVRRELFPYSDCLKAAQREGILFEEITNSNADIICLQEVDRLEKLTPVLESAGYAFTYASGHRKKHGCAIAYLKCVFKKVADQTVFYDDVDVRPDGPSERARRGSSFRTRNIGLIVSLERIGVEDQHTVVATTHLFWHPRYTYERARQALILARSVIDFKAAHNLRGAPTFLAGDFNFNPSDAAYALLVGDSLTPAQEADIATSRVVHVSIDPSVPLADPKKAAAEDDEEGAEADSEEDDPDRTIKNARRAGPEDGLLDARELAAAFAVLPPLRSAYDEWRGPTIDSSRTFGTRVSVAEGRRGAREPMYTSYTKYWKVTLDYIFMLQDPKIPSYEVLGVLEPPATESLGAGLPLKGVCGSDHLSVHARIAWSSDAT